MIPHFVNTVVEISDEFLSFFLLAVGFTNLCGDVLPRRVRLINRQDDAICSSRSISSNAESPEFFATTMKSGAYATAL
ncbi:hypothetical protein BA700_07130 [Corynebacterium stationis]|nr:hypothetical protein BA700_07130 [Corynebacterium stationis]